MFVPDAQRRWDVVGAVGWRGVNKSEIAPEWNEWYDVGSFSAAVGRYLTPHFKLDLDVAITSTASLYEQTPVVAPGPVTFFQIREHHFRRTTLATTLAYQFLENRWVHPYLGLGAEGVREARRIESEFLPVRPPFPPQPSPLEEEDVAYSVRPLFTAGIKFYMSERGFIRTDVLSTFSSHGGESAVWRVGVGVDF
jgi:hypothetical protein